MSQFLVEFFTKSLHRGGVSQYATYMCARVHCTPSLAIPRQATPLPLKRGIHYQSLALIKCQINHFFLSHNRLACQPARVNWRACTPVVAGGKPTSILLLIPKGRRNRWARGIRGGGEIVPPPVNPVSLPVSY